MGEPEEPRRKTDKETIWSARSPTDHSPQTMKRGTLYALITTPRLITQGNAELSALEPDQKESTTRPRDQSSCLDITTSHDKQAETGTFQQGDEVLGEEITYKLPENKGKAYSTYWNALQLTIL